MKCSLCNEEIQNSKIICDKCGEEQRIMNNDLVDYLIEKYKEYNNRIIQYSKDEYYDTYETRAAKQTQIKIYKEIVTILKMALKGYTNIDIENVEIEEYPISKPRMCDMYKGKICDGCGDC
ncbi:hypothetical protein [Clostridium rectalis]|uniref:hypothetical protein n=1 Tax=Clostridium rectalis TaxID=2040295 RepID=UPI000F633277|nr:hypothetical protein [Clostridium rectalis]